MNKQNIASKIEGFSQSYKEYTKVWRYYYNLPQSFEDIKNNSLYAIKYYAMMAHERAGANPEFPKYHIIALEGALDDRDFNYVILNDKNYPDKVWKSFDDLTNNKPNERLTKGVVRDILENMQIENEPNIIRLLCERDIDSARKFLRDIKGIGDKLSAFIMRDFYDFFNCWRDDITNDKTKYYHLQPIDRWVKRISNLIWGINVDKSHDKVAKDIVNSCLNNNVNPVKFNQGAWFIGAHFNYLCSFYDIPLKERHIGKLVNLINKFDPNEVLEGLKKYTNLYFQKAIFPII